MGIFRRRSSSRISGRKKPSSASVTSAPIPAGDPNPRNWKIVKAEEYAKHLIIELKYPDCTNYEGNKILLFENVSLVELVNQGMIDPHFFKDSKYKSPIARFEPTKRGWEMARKLVKVL